MPKELLSSELDSIVLEQHRLYMLLFSLVIRHDERLRADVAEAIRLILQNPIQTCGVSSILELQLRAFRDELLKSAPPEMVAALSQPPVRPVK